MSGHTWWKKIMNDWMSSSNNKMMKSLICTANYINFQHKHKWSRWCRRILIYSVLELINYLSRILRCQAKFLSFSRRNWIWRMNWNSFREIAICTNRSLKEQDSNWIIWLRVTNEKLFNDRIAVCEDLKKRLVEANE